ncbi:hypothetical protein GJ496_004928 [Pomphorhynchus laevis]|nr:hypothetical protein GJ496_004928 [Pomphorhynchus laevis]
MKEKYKTCSELKPIAGKILVFNEQSTSIQNISMTTVNKDKSRLLKCSQSDNVRLQQNSSSFQKYVRAAVDAEDDDYKDSENMNTTVCMARNTWARPPVPIIDHNSTDIIFQLIDCDVYSSNEPNMDNKTVVRLYGVTENENSIMAHMSGYVVFFYIRKPVEFDYERDHDLFEKEFNKAIEGNIGGYQQQHGKCVIRCMLEMKQSIYGYSAELKNPFLKIFLSSPKLLTPARKILENGFSLTPSCPFQSFETYNSNIDIEVRCLADLNIQSCGWLKVPASTYAIRKSRQFTSGCQIEISLNYKNLVNLPNEGQWMGIAPLRILSFDIECISPKGTFPDAKRDSVIQIANMVQTYGSDEEPSIRNVFTLKSCARILGSHVLSFDREADLLESWADFFRTVDPDVVTGYNIQNFDFPFLFTRAEVLKVKKFSMLGRLIDMKSHAKSVTLQSKQFGRRETHSINLEGRFLLDMFQVLTREYKLRSYSLNSVSYQFLGEQKEDVHHSIIGDLQNGNADTRRRLAIYCLKDAYLPLRLLNKLLSLVHHIEMARVTGVNLCHLLTRGQQIKVVSQLLRKANFHNFLIPNIPVSDASEEYVGGEVLEPIKGYYNTPITTLDFASLYPSIMIAYNMCYTTLLNEQSKSQLNSNQYFQAPTGGCFVKPEIRKGILPEILSDLLSARKSTKDAMKLENDDFRKSLLDGAQVGKLPCLSISQGITSFGRQMIEKTKNLIESHFITANGYTSNAQVIYGDTDSVMVKFNLDSLEESMKIGKEAASYVTSFFQTPIQLQFEKCYFPFLLISKKRYAGLSFTKIGSYDKIDCKGIETVRRDNCPLVANCISVCLRKLLVERLPNDAVNHVKDVIADLLCNRTDISQLIITKELTKADSDYAAKQAHVELASKMRKRDPGNAPNLGDRVPFVIVAGSKGEPTYKRAEDPVYVLNNCLPIDTQYYLENQLSKPILRILEPVLGDNAESLLFKGQHTLVRTQVTSKVGALLAFTKRRATCFVCKAVMDNDQDAVCPHCQCKRRQAYLKEISRLRTTENRFRMLWTECQSCQGNLLEEIICSNRDCPIYFARTKVRNDLSDAIKRINQFKNIEE